MGDILAIVSIKLVILGNFTLAFCVIRLLIDLVALFPNHCANESRSAAQVHYYFCAIQHY
jgi:hypothetical protein